MREPRERRGRPPLGQCRLRSYVVAALVVVLVGITAPLASQSSALSLPPLPLPIPIPGVGAAQGSTGGTNATPKHAARTTQSNPFSGRGMWIWYLSSSNHGNLSSIVATARQYGIRTLMIKSGDGASVWSQFSAPMVSFMHANGIRVCGWQYVYGIHPVGEAKVGAAAAKNGADCLLIDAESEYEGKYVQAQTYIQKLRKLVGSGLPLALASFPYVDYHPSLPYSVFLGPGGAQYNVPQMYWLDIGTTVDAVYSHTYTFNRPYGRQIAPLGQVYNSPPARDVKRFRQLSRAYGASGLSWWDWQEAPHREWVALSQPVGAIANYNPNNSYARLGQGSRGDLVVWAQLHLVSAGYRMTVDGDYGPATRAAVQSFQSQHGLSASGAITSATWRALLRYPAAPVRWTRGGALVAADQGAGGVTGAGQIMRVPRSASLPSRRYEIPRSLGAG